MVPFIYAIIITLMIPIHYQERLEIEQIAAEHEMEVAEFLQHYFVHNVIKENLDNMQQENEMPIL